MALESVEASRINRVFPKIDRSGNDGRMQNKLFSSPMPIQLC